jgi:hypothetical protein
MIRIMSIKSVISSFIILVTTLSSLFSQTFFQPKYSLKSHQTLNIIKIEARSEATIFYLSIENQIEGGSFCADKNIYIIYPDGKKSKLESSSGIPVCPDTHKFKAPGEKLEFVLSFPPLKKGTEWIDLIEECSDNCFSFYGISLNNDINKRIDDAFTFAENNEPIKAMGSFVAVLEEIDKYNSGIEGLLYINIIKLAIKTGDDAKGREWYKKFNLSNAPRLSQYIKYLNDQGIKF